MISNLISFLFHLYGNEPLKERQCENWFDKICPGDFSQKIVQQFGCPVEVKESQIKTITDSDRHSTTREIAEKLIISHKYIEKQNSLYMSRISIYGSMINLRKFI